MSAIGLALAAILSTSRAIANDNAIPESAYSALAWRLVGPLRGGWATAASGVPGAPHTFYFGAADGGVWKTTDAGRTWKPLFQHEKAASIGALEIAPSDPNVIWVGAGQVTTRWDVTSGNGVYRSRDGGLTWEHRGLADTQHIGRLWIDPRDPSTVLVAALGHLYGPNAERGVFRTSDGGATWTKVLFVDENTGAVDLAADPSAPEVIFASTWQARRFPWQAYFTPIVGPGSAIHRSADGGRTWTRLAGHGLPERALGRPEHPLGRIGLAVARGSKGQCVYATIDAGEGGGLFRSNDSGATWTRVNADTDLANSYFAALTVDPRNREKIYVMGRSIRASIDGGKTFEYVRGAPGGDDYHMLWIDPDAPERRITASDQGTVVTLNGGESWSSWYNQPTGQFYRLSTDDRFPYWIYSGQQDSGTAALASRGDYGQLTFRDWHPVGAEERDSDIPFPGHPEIVFGSGLGGRVSRWDERTGQVRVVSPWPVSSYGQHPSNVRYRSTWLSPLAISPHPPHAIYLGAQVLFRSLDQGDTWETITGDVTKQVAGAPDCDGDVAIERASACGYGVIFAIALSPLTDRVIWLGTDNGIVHLSQDGGESWREVTPPAVSDWSKIAEIDASPIDPASAYVAVDRHRLDDFAPYVYVTHDFGSTWRVSNAGLPTGGYVNVVRQDPVRAELLYAGTSRGAFVSFDDGAKWQPLQHELPTTGINDLCVHGNDLVVATQGRGIWALDDVSILRKLDARTLAEPVALFPPAKAFRLSPNQNRDTPLPADEPRADNPPSGAVVDYWLAKEPREVSLAFVDPSGTVVRTFHSETAEKRPNATVYFPEDWLQPATTTPKRAGHNRFVWNLRHERPRATDYEYAMAAVPGADTPALPQGIFVRPATYTVRLTVDGATVEAPLEIAADPRVAVTAATLEEQFAFYRTAVETLERSTDARAEVDELREQLKKRESDLSSERAPQPVRDAANKLSSELGRFRTGTSDDNLSATGDALTSLVTDLESADAAPTKPQRECHAEYARRLDAALAHWKALEAGPVRELDRAMQAAGMTMLGP